MYFGRLKGVGRSDSAGWSSSTPKASTRRAAPWANTDRRIAHGGRTKRHMNAFTRLTELLDRHSGRFILAAVALTLLLIVPLVVMSPEDQASVDPGGDVFELQADIDDRFKALIHSNGYIVEARGEDILTQAVLWELYQNTRELQAADERGDLAPKDLPAQSYLYQAFDTDSNRPFTGLNTLADEIQRVLSHPAFESSLEVATEDQVKLAVHILFSVI